MSLVVVGPQPELRGSVAEIGLRPNTSVWVPQRSLARSVTSISTRVAGTYATRPDGLRSVGVEIRSQGAVPNEVFGEQTERNA